MDAFAGQDTKLRQYLDEKILKPLEKAKAKAADYTLYTVKAGDSFWRIASQQMGSGLKCSQLASFNGLKLTSIIKPGQVLKIPKK